MNAWEPRGIERETTHDIHAAVSSIVRMERRLDLWDELNKHLAGYNWTSPMQQSVFGVSHASRGRPYVTCTGTGHYIRTVHKNSVLCNIRRQK